MERRNTAKKKAIIEELKQLKTHPTATELADRLSSEGKDVSRATVFRVLSALADDGVIKRVEVENSDTRYDGNVEPHYHFECRKCGRVMDVEMKYQTGMDRDLSREGFLVEGHSAEFYGICPDCRNAEEEAE